MHFADDLRLDRVSLVHADLKTVLERRSRNTDGFTQIDLTCPPHPRTILTLRIV